MRDIRMSWRGRVRLVRSKLPPALGIGHQLSRCATRAPVRQHHGAIGIRLRAFELRLIARHLRFGLAHCRFERRRIDLEQQIALRTICLL